MKPLALLVYEWLAPFVLLGAVVYEIGRRRRMPRQVEIPALLVLVCFGLGLVLIYPEARDMTPSVSDIAILGLLALLIITRVLRTKRQQKPDQGTGGTV